jgi:hypothetical protein
LAIKNKLSFETVDAEGKPLKLVVKRPTPAQITDGENVYNRTFANALKGGGILNGGLSKHIRDQGIWDEERQKKFDELDKRLTENYLKLRKGGAAGLKKSDGREIAIQIKRDKLAQRMLTSEVEKLQEFTVESQSFQKRIEYFVSVCTLTEGGKPYFKDVEDYVGRIDEQSARDATAKFMILFFNVDADADKKLPENEFLLKYGFVNEKLQFVDKDGNLVDLEGRRIDDEGFLLDAEGRRVSEDGELLDSNGEVIVETAEFLED